MSRKYQKTTPKNCLACGKEFRAFPCLNRKLCGKLCHKQYMLMHPEWTEPVRNMAAFTGHKHSEDAKKKMSEAGKRRVAEGKTDIVKMSELARPHNIGAKNVNWKGGVTTESRKQRIMFRKQTQKQIFARDGYACVKCKKVGGNLHVDHIESWADHPELRFEESNCQTLCMGCHYEKTFGREKPDGLVWGNNLKKAESGMTS